MHGDEFVHGGVVRARARRRRRGSRTSRCASRPIRSSTVPRQRPADRRPARGFGEAADGSGTAGGLVSSAARAVRRVARRGPLAPPRRPPEPGEFAVQVRDQRIGVVVVVPQQRQRMPPAAGHPGDLVQRGSGVEPVKRLARPQPRRPRRRAAGWARRRPRARSRPGIRGRVRRASRPAARQRSRREPAAQGGRRQLAGAGGQVEHRGVRWRAVSTVVAGGSATSSAASG